MFRIFSTPNTSVSPSETMNSHDAYVIASVRIVRACKESPALPPPEPSPASQGRGPVPSPACGGGSGRGPQTESSSLALRPREPRLDPVDALRVRRRVHTLRLEALDVGGENALARRVVLGASDRRFLDCLLAVAE